ncbi:MAG: DUF2383 domain-containing protein [Verrucomicrobiaceae bacterium]|nr:MAG: DUF2383 domain-containing protein [Verrucomicrobiaceae bacterium]
MNTETRNCVSACNKLLRGEISAIETYQQALEKFADSPHRATIDQILDDHRKSADALRKHIADMGGTADTESGLWGQFAKAVEGTAKLMGDGPAIAALKQGEEHGISEYKEAINDPGVMAEAKVMYRDTLIPRLQKHIAVLEALPT